MYLNQSPISYEGSKKIHYAEYFVLGQILKRSDSKNLEGARCYSYSSTNKASTNEDLYKCVGEIIVGGDQIQIFLDYRFLKTLKSLKFYLLFKKKDSQCI